MGRVQEPLPRTSRSYKRSEAPEEGVSKFDARINDTERVPHQLSRYAPDDVCTKEKKQDCFLEGLNTRL